MAVDMYGKPPDRQTHPQSRDSHQSDRAAKKPGPGKVPLTRNTAPPAGGQVQRKPAPVNVGAAKRPVQHARKWTADPYIDTALRGTPLPTTAAVQAKTDPGRAVQMRDATRERDGANDELDRRLSGSHGSQSDGSGDWGADSDDRGVTDRANHYMWSRIALVAESWGLTNAARHMRHYLGNTGADLQVDPDLMLRDVPDLAAAYDAHIASLQAEANQTAHAMSISGSVSTSLQTPRMSDVYCDKSASADWFYAIGGFTYWVTAEVTFTLQPDGTIQAEMVTQLHIFDRYNWDGGKAVTIGGITVTDEQLGRLHRVGLAREFEVHGSSTSRTTIWQVTASSPAPSSGAGSAASDRQGGRSDPSRERGRHFDNVRGSE